MSILYHEAYIPLAIHKQLDSLDKHLLWISSFLPSRVSMGHRLPHKPGSQPTRNSPTQLSCWPRNSWKMEQTWTCFFSKKVSLEGKYPDQITQSIFSYIFPNMIHIIINLFLFHTLIFFTCLLVAHCSPRRRSWRRTSTHSSSMMANCSNWPPVKKRFFHPIKKWGPPNVIWKYAAANVFLSQNTEYAYVHADWRYGWNGIQITPPVLKRLWTTLMHTKLPNWLCNKRLRRGWPSG